MRLVCINTTGWYQDKKALFGLITYKRNCKGPKYGDIVTKIKDVYEEGILYYILVEWPDANDEGFEATSFIPLSEIDETEMERNYKTEKV